MQLSGTVRRVHHGGLVVAATAFLVTRLLVAETVRVDAALPSVLSGLLALVIGLGLAVFGVVLAVGAFPRTYVATVARWCVIGTGSMVLVFAVTAVGATDGGMIRLVDASQTLVANVLLAGAVGGVLVGDRSARNRRQRREVRRQANRGTVLNRMLRDEVLNAVAVVNGYAPFLSDDADTPEETVEAIGEATRRIERTVEEVGTIAEGPEDRSLRAVDLAEHLREQVETLRSLDPGVAIHPADCPESVAVRADGRVGTAIRGLLRHAEKNATGSEISVALSTTGGEARIEVAYDGSPLVPQDRALLRSGELPEYDDPTVGFDLQMAWLLVDRYGGRIDADSDAGTTRITAVVPRAADAEDGESPVGVSSANLRRASVAGLVAGVAMGMSVQVLGGGLPIIGALYGVESVAVGWITHLFHSLVFALLFVAWSSWPPLRDRTGSVAGVTTLGVAWGVVLALVAAGLVMPAWLDATGVQAMLPNVSAPGLLGHVLWGLVLGGGYGALRERDVGTSERIADTLGFEG